MDWVVYIRCQWCHAIYLLCLQRYDSQNVAVIDSKVLANKLGIYSDGRATPKHEDQSKHAYTFYYGCYFLDIQIFVWMKADDTLHLLFSIFTQFICCHYLAILCCSKLFEAQRGWQTKVFRYWKMVEKQIQTGIPWPEE